LNEQQKKAAASMMQQPFWHLWCSSLFGIYDAAALFWHPCDTAVFL